MYRCGDHGWESREAVSRVYCDCVFLLVGEDDLHNARSTVVGLAGRWKDLGISLGLHPGDLDTILSANPHSPSSCLRDMLVLWLKQSYNVCTPLQN